MPKTLLNQGHRKAIVKAVLAHRFDPDEKALETRRYALAETVYASLCDAPTLEKMNALPFGWLRSYHQIDTTFGGNGWGNNPTLILKSGPRPFLGRDTKS